MESSKCPKCGEEPRFIAHVSKWYCFGCNSYIDEVEDAPKERAGPETTVEQGHEVVRAPKEPSNGRATECKNCGAELQGLKDGKLYCFVCETYQDDFKPPEHKENEAQTLVNQAASPVITPEATPAVPAELVAAQPVPEPKPEQAPDPVPVPVTAPETVSSSVPEAPALAGPSAEAEKPAYVKMCSSCGQPLKYIDKYQRYYCYGCRKYAPKDEKLKGPQEKKTCPECGGELRFIEKHNEYYCNACKKYPLRASRKVTPSETDVHPCPKCKEPLKWIERYSRYYCYTCKEYAPKGYGDSPPSMPSDIKTCPNCGSTMRYVAEYDEWYCYKCKKYSLRPSKPTLLA